jgi:hypothetical protein
MDPTRRAFIKANLVLPTIAGGAAIAGSSAFASTLPAALSGPAANPIPASEAEKAAAVNIAEPMFPPGNVRRYGAQGNGSSDDTAALQAGFDAAQAANFSFPVYLPTGDYVINSPLKIRGGAPKSLVLVGEGGAFGIRNTKITVGNRWSGDAMIQSDGKRKNGWTIADIWFDAGTKAKCILDLRELNYLTLRGCRFASAIGTVDRHGLAAVTLNNGWVTRFENCVFAGCRDALYCGVSTNNLNLWGCSFVGNKGIGFRGRGCQSVNIAGSVFEDNEQTGILLDICRSVWINGNYFEMNGEKGYAYQKGDKRTIRADIIANGWVSPEIRSKDPCKGIGVFGNFFFPPKDGPLDSSIYLIAVDGFTEGANEVHRPYPQPAAFVKTKNQPGVYMARELSLGNSFVAGLPTRGGSDAYFDIDALDNQRAAAYDIELAESIYVHPRIAPRLNAHEDLGFDPTNYEVQVDSSKPLVISRSEARRMGRPVYRAECAASGTSNVMGATVPESAYEEFWSGRIWMVYLEVSAISGSPTFEVSVRTGGQTFRSSGRVSGGFVPHAVIFKPVAGQDVKFGISMTNPSANTKIAFSRPVICPLGSMNDLSGPYAN